MAAAQPTAPHSTTLHSTTLQTTGRRNLPPARRSLTSVFRPLPFVPVVAVAVLAALADVFWMTSLQGASGAIERAQDPFRLWLVVSAVAVPLYLAGLAGVMAVARRWLSGVASGRPRLRPVLGLLVLVAVTTLVGVAGLGANAAWDYHLQTRLIGADHAHSEGIVIGDNGQIQVGSIVVPGCYGDCAVRRQTRDTHLRALRLGSLILLATNIGVVLWVVALRGGSLRPGAGVGLGGRRRRVAVNRSRSPKPAPATTT